jgi:hypothetical protein
MDTSPRLPSTVTCMMMHVKDRPPIATMTDDLRTAVAAAQLSQFLRRERTSPWRPSSTP